MVDLNNDDIENVNSVSTASATINDKPAFSGDGLTEESPGFDTWTQASASKPVLLFIQLLVGTDGTDGGRVLVEVDESGGTTADYELEIGNAPPGLGSGGSIREVGTIFVRPGGQYRITNLSDPSGSNSIEDVLQLLMG